MHDRSPRDQDPGFAMQMMVGRAKKGAAVEDTMPADGTGAAANKQDLGMSRWQLFDDVTSSSWMRVRGHRGFCEDGGGLFSCCCAADRAVESAAAGEGGEAEATAVLMVAGRAEP